MFIIAVSLAPVIVLAIVQGVVRYRIAVEDAHEILNQQAHSAFEAGANIFKSAQPVLSALAAQEPVAGGGDACSIALRNALIGLRTYTNITLVDRDGTIVCAALPLPENRRIDDLPWWREAVTRDRFMISAAVFGSMSRQTIMLAVQPLHDKDGTFQGVIAASIGVESLDRLMRSVRPEGNSILALFDQSGNLVVSNDLIKASQIFAGSGRLQPSAGLVTVADNRGRSWVRQTATLIDGDVVIGYAVPEVDALGWTYFDIFLNVLLPILAVVAAVLAIWLAANRQILYWLSYLGRISRAYAGGRYTVRPNKAAEAPYEIASLAATMAAMAGEIEQRDLHLKTALQQKAELVREVHHRVKNNIQIIASLMNLQARRLTDPHAKRLLDQTVSRLNALALVHRLLQGIEDRPLVNLPELIEALMEQLHQGFNGEELGITHSSDIADLNVDPDQAVPLILFTVEVLTNAYKHAFKGRIGGHIEVALRRQDDGSLVLSISDDGVGLSMTAEEVEAGTGTQLTRAFARQLYGAFETTVRPDGGTSVTLTFRLPEQPGSVDKPAMAAATGDQPDLL